MVVGRDAVGGAESRVLLDDHRSRAPGIRLMVPLGVIL
jgi:hypothetical protein